MGFQGVYRLAPNHNPADEAELVSDRHMFSQPNGLTPCPCEKFMCVNDTEQANIRFFPIADDGRLINGRVVASGIRESARAGLPDGMKADREGNIHVTAPGGVWVYDFHGVKLGKIICLEQAVNLHWGGNGWDTLFMCTATVVYQVRTKSRPHLEPFMLADTGLTTDAAAVADLAAPAALTSVAPVAARINPATTAVIIQDMQNDVMIDGGAFAASGSPDHARDKNVVSHSARLAAASRGRGMMVLHVLMVLEPGAPCLAQHVHLMQGLSAENVLVLDTWGFAPAPGLEPQNGDLIVEKMSISAWETSRLEAYLNHARIDTIISTGAWTNMSAEHTSRTVADRGIALLSRIMPVRP